MVGAVLSRLAYVLPALVGMGSGQVLKSEMMEEVGRSRRVALVMWTALSLFVAMAI